MPCSEEGLTPQFIWSDVTIEEINDGAKSASLHHQDFANDQFFSWLLRPQHSFDGDFRVRLGVKRQINITSGSDM